MRYRRAAEKALRHTLFEKARENNIADVSDYFHMHSKCFEYKRAVFKFERRCYNNSISAAAAVTICCVPPKHRFMGR
ncbi:MAG: hypothetical protein LKJ76_01275 [Lachnospiraceae bacterium]|jgi:hypothetical protein|nr:hypothetical protein [Lachnospiraceae bacterium]